MRPPRTDWADHTPLWPDPQDPARLWVIDQRALPHRLEFLALDSVEAAAAAIREMAVRGAPLIGAVAAWSLCCAARRAPRGRGAVRVEAAADLLRRTRPTARDLFAAIERQVVASRGAPDDDARAAALEVGARNIWEESSAECRRIGEHGLALIEATHAAAPNRPVNILTHCNAGWLACVEFGTATAPIYLAHRRGIPVHIWVDETRPRNQGAALTAWELARGGVPHTLIVDNAGGHLMQLRRVDLVLVGADRVSRRGDVANKIGTYLKALAARDNGIPFYAAAPTSTWDFSASSLDDLHIEERDPDEVRTVAGVAGSTSVRVRICPPNTPALNPAFDVTPARLITGLVTSRGVLPPDATAIGAAFPEICPP